MNTKRTKSRSTMTYDVFSATAPAAPTLGIGLEVLKLAIKKCSKDMHDVLIPGLIPALGSYIREASFVNSSGLTTETCGLMHHLVGGSSDNKSQLSRMVNAIMHRAKEHDKKEYQDLFNWQKEHHKKAANSRKEERPHIALLMPPEDITRPAFIQNAMGCEEQGNLTQLFSFSELESIYSLCQGKGKVQVLIRKIFDVEHAGSLRATAEGVTGDPTLRVNISVASTDGPARAFYRKDIDTGTFGRVNIAFKPAAEERSGTIPRLGELNEEFYTQLDTYIDRLSECRGIHKIAELNRLADKLAIAAKDIADACDNNTVHAVAKRSIVMAWKAGCILWVANDQQWTKSIGRLVQWLFYFDIWSKIQVFGDMMIKPSANRPCARPVNILDTLSDEFTYLDLEAVRKDDGVSRSQNEALLRQWIKRGNIVRDEQPDTYRKTPQYLASHRHIR